MRGEGEEGDGEEEEGKYLYPAVAQHFAGGLLCPGGSAQDDEEREGEEPRLGAAWAAGEDKNWSGWGPEDGRQEWRLVSPESSVWLFRLSLCLFLSLSMLMVMMMVVKRSPSLASLGSQPLHLPRSARRRPSTPTRFRPLPALLSPAFATDGEPVVLRASRGERRRRC